MAKHLDAMPVLAEAKKSLTNLWHRDRRHMLISFQRACSAVSIMVVTVTDPG
jgi:hypothetical protein